MILALGALALSAVCSLAVAVAAAQGVLAAIEALFATRMAQTYGDQPRYRKSIGESRRAIVVGLLCIPAGLAAFAFFAYELLGNLGWLA